jgi:hypothetical protein
MNMNKLENVRVINLSPSQAPVNFMDALALLFIGLKLTGHLDDWTWVAALSPLWAPFMLHWLFRLVIFTFFSNHLPEEE